MLLSLAPSSETRVNWAVAEPAVVHATIISLTIQLPSSCVEYRTRRRLILALTPVEARGTIMKTGKPSLLARIKRVPNPLTPTRRRYSGGFREGWIA